MGVARSDPHFSSYPAQASFTDHYYDALSRESATALLNKKISFNMYSATVLPSERQMLLFLGVEVERGTRNTQK